MAVDTLSAPPATRRLPRRLARADLDRAERASDLAKVLADPVRVAILELLRQADGPVCQCELSPLFAISQPTLSHHLAKLAGAGLVTVQRRGKWAYYLVDTGPLEDLRAWLSHGTA